ncbi:THUMP-like domain-containing protein [Streptomyces albireticuli]|uniref:SAM-dependent methyltransferase n=1 Tax=Streptomyces albireticuli TaxID=1940 RepID=A0A2A2DBN9_9ACTN|nr:methyltransferase domain-containing protein [Streptomyces albireticuli]MCD9144668.1 class I SAM-dependent methyltransferase [Streptomyces albireticuli]MCD9165416.1 class I SAM-dependent methyltransferase [Streptomyces albireticuli]MCD9193575.1 class I SAM-dependent methyltransferase [Streptomyces albireticuli]PAU49898.1 SAM-dependent methyltransferase [Streptomyces albireticuli]
MRHVPAPNTQTAASLHAFAALLTDEGRRLLADLRDHDPAQELATATRLRRDHPAELVSAALGQARLRQRAVAKFGAEDAFRMFFTPNGVEQSTRKSVAEYRAARFAGLGIRSVADLCCGIGGDAIALARLGIRVLAVDRDPLTCEAARANAEALGLAELIEVRCADVAEIDTTGYDAVFVDPARRGGRGRIFDPEAYSPPLSWAVGAALKAPHAALKIAPGVPHEAVPDGAEAEWISDGGDVKEAVLWFGTAPGTRRATLLPGAHTLVGAGLPDPAVRPVGRYLYEPDGAVIRAHLVADVAERVAGGLIDETIAYVTSDRLVETPYAAAYEITDVMPFNLKKLKALLRERKVGVVTVKKRGSAVEPEELRKKLKLDGANSCTILLTRVAGAPTMLLGHPAHA